MYQKCIGSVYIISVVSVLYHDIVIERNTILIN